MAQWHFPTELTFWITQLALPLQAGVAGRLVPILLGVLFAQGRQTVTAWLRAADVSQQFPRYFYFLGALGRKTKLVAAQLLRLVLGRLVRGDRLLFVIDDTPTKRYGPKVQGAGIHHNPTPGPADQKFLYGHLWVTLALIVRHPIWGTIGLPLLAMLYVRRGDIGKIPPAYGIEFRTKLQQAADLIEWVADQLKWLGKPLWVVVDGFYAKREVLRRAKELGVIVVGRLRKDAALWSVPLLEKVRRRGRRRIYGTQRLHLDKRARNKGGWKTVELVLYGRKIEKTFKTFLATWRPVGGSIRVVLVKESVGPIAFFCTDPAATVAQILESVADRSAIEQDFHDLKEVHGAGKQQLRNYWSNLACFHLTAWMHTLIELWAWKLPQTKLIDRHSSPWDDPTRRPSHADRKNALKQACIGLEIKRSTAGEPISHKILRLLKRLANLAA